MRQQWKNESGKKLRLSQTQNRKIQVGRFDLAVHEGSGTKLIVDCGTSVFLEISSYGDRLASATLA
ncbi:MAG: hypothetical protein WBV55_03255 [Candidatus Sulfotelmatobacter sp.]